MNIIRSGEPIIPGVSEEESVITVFSCSDYGGQGNNAGILLVTKD